MHLILIKSLTIVYNMHLCTRRSFLQQLGDLTDGNGSTLISQGEST